MKKLVCVFLLGLLAGYFSESFGQPIFLKKEQITGSTDLDLWLHKSEGLICNIETNKPYSGKITGWSGVRNRVFRHLNHFGAPIYGSDQFGRAPNDKKLFLIGKVKRGREVNTWYYYSEDSILRAKAHFKKGLFDGKAKIYYKNGRIARIEEFKSDTLDGHVIEYDKDGNITLKDVYKKGEFIETLIEIDN